ncbi:MAG: FAD-binding oxidoreductase, partial [Gemmatimonadota bacterium]
EEPSGADGDAPGLVLVSTERLDAVIELRPRDFTVTVGPGLRIGRLREAVEERGLWLAAGGSGAARSVGGWIAASSPGPWDAAFGPVRRQLLACRVATHDGRLFAWGRPVMKNVAGYDLPRLMAGSRGRLGALSRVTLRLWPRPDAVEAHEMAGDPERLETLLPELEAAGVDLLAWLWSPGSGHRLRILLAGSAASVARRRSELARRAAARGTAVAEAPPEEVAEDRADRARPPGTIAFRWTPGRRYLPRGLRDLAASAGPRPARIEAYPATGAVVATFGGAPDPVAVPAGPLAIERGGPEFHEEAERRRSPAARAIEERVVAALGGRSRTWQADYL